MKSYAFLKRNDWQKGRTPHGHVHVQINNNYDPSTLFNPRKIYVSN